MNIKDFVTSNFYKSSFWAKQHKPELLMISGGVAVIGGIVTACIATTKASDIIKKHKDAIEEIHLVEADETISDTYYSAEDAKKDTVCVYAKTFGRFAIAYLPSVALTTVGFTCFISAYNELHSRNMALTTALASMTESFRVYRKRVVGRFGEDVDHELRYGTKAEKVKKTEVNSDGNEAEVETIEQVIKDNTTGDYTRYFDESNRHWRKNGELNRTFLMAQEQWANDVLRTKKFLFLNEVLEAIGIRGCPEGAIAGWVYRPNDPTYQGDGYVSFGIQDAVRPIAPDFDDPSANRNVERTYILDFNVDGNILNYADWSLNGYYA